MIRRWVLLLAWALACAASAAPGELTLGPDDSYPLSRVFTYLEDPRGELTLQDVLQPPVQARFRPVPQGGPGANFGLTPSAFWLRVQLNVPADAPSDWMLELAYPPLDRVELFSQHDGFDYQRQLGGDLQAFGARVVPHRHHVFPVRLTLGGSSVLYLRLKSEGTVTAPVTLWRPNALWQHDQAEYGILSLYFGLLIGLLLYNLLLFVSVRDPGYLIYVAFVGSMACAQAALTGLGSQFVWPQRTWWNSVSPSVCLSSAAIFGVLFTRHFLVSARRMPRLDRFMLVQMAAWCLTLVAGLTLPYTVSTWMVTGMAVLSVATVVLVGVVTIRRNFAGARLFFTAWAVLLLGVVTLTLHNSGALPSNVVTANSLLIGSALEMVLLSFALADRINVARRFKEKAQARIAAEHAMVEALSQAQNQLQRVVREREAILNSMLVGIVLSVNRRHQWVNEKFARMLGCPAETLIGKSSLHIHADQESWERFGAAARTQLAQTGFYSCEHQLRRHNGELFWVEMSGSCVNPKQPEAGVIWTVLDLTEQREAEARIRPAGTAPQTA